MPPLASPALADALAPALLAAPAPALPSVPDAPALVELEPSVAGAEYDPQAAEKVASDSAPVEARTIDRSLIIAESPALGFSQTDMTTDMGRGGESLPWRQSPFVKPLAVGQVATR